ncbi:hypothetical protein HNR42_001084 [Deinobacterium chartae]|uniref:Uncharacterized protein n=1 Tax=Deinobacterium chartae TaxID=521158 RepID=A0A841HW97_9DEIO|nr:hypothetical protein [Deinobacterium chartae]MBB6097667.1 hypothetical protein [Deinobacterium chartae]
MNVRRRGIRYRCHGYRQDRRAVLEGDVILTELFVDPHPAWPEGITAGTERLCRLEVSGPLPDLEAFEAELYLPGLRETWRVRVQPETVDGNELHGRLEVLGSERLRVPLD